MSVTKPIVIKRTRTKTEDASDEDVLVIAQQLEGLLKFLATLPDEISVTVERGSQTIAYRVGCAQTDIGKILGKKGVTIAGFRAVFHAITCTRGFRSVIELPYFEKNDD